VPTRDDIRKEKKRIQARFEALRLNALLDKTKINKALLDQQQEFENTPAHHFITKRLYQPHPSVKRENPWMASTFSPSNTLKDIKTRPNFNETNAFMSTA
jgi:hypothetical protein